MKTLNKQQRCKLAEAVLTFYGTKRVCEITDLTPQAVLAWKYNGIPRTWIKVFETTEARFLVRNMLRGFCNDSQC
ncbi:Uncharacterised protein [Anaerobiospirillum thomasii]|nr:Uncharacterised protein [Anaerobiospirillum thomasii]